MARIYEPVGPSSNKAVAPVSEVKKSRGSKNDGKKDEGGEKGRLECAIAYPGTKVRIGSEVLHLRHVERRCVISLVQNEIVVT